jgi:hypothetical protein
MVPVDDPCRRDPGKKKQGTRLGCVGASEGSSLFACDFAPYRRGERAMQLDVISLNNSSTRSKACPNIICKKLADSPNLQKKFSILARHVCRTKLLHASRRQERPLLAASLSRHRDCEIHFCGLQTLASSHMQPFNSVEERKRQARRRSNKAGGAATWHQIHA